MTAGVPGDDRHRDAATRMAALLAFNQPFYPLYVWWLAGDAGWRAAIVCVAVPFFLMVPVAARRSSLAARLLLPVTGILNTLLATYAVGGDIGLEYFLVPCAALAAILLRRGERGFMLGVIALAAGCFILAMHAAPSGFAADAAAALRRLNGLSAILLCGLAGWLSPAEPARGLQLHA
jgi:hypothetical protein